MPDDPRFATYLTAMQRHGTHPLRLETTVADLLVITSTLQLALRHPRLGARVRTSVKAFLAEAIAGVAQLDPVLGEVARLGNDPLNDVPAREASHHA